MLLCAGAIAVGVNETLFWLAHVYEPNARVRSNFTVLSSSVNGHVAQVRIKRGQSVQKGDVLVSMNTAMERLTIKSLQADIDRERAESAQVEAELVFFLSELEDKIASASAAIEQFELKRMTLNERLAIARKNVERNNALQTRSVVASQRVDDANDKMLAIISQQRDLQTSASAAAKRLVELEGQRKREAVYRSRLQVIAREIEKMEVAVERSDQRLTDMHVYSPHDAIISEVHINAGQYVEDGDPMVLLHDPSTLWIEANVDESDIRHVKVGQPVLIEIDAYPYEEFAGEVETIGRVTLASIAQPTDSDVSGAQRIPVTITMPPIERAVWPGMRAAVNIVVRRDP
jgi:membrane fusion protein, multidrug efflux system